MRRKTGKSIAKKIIAGMAVLLLFANTSISVFASSDRVTPSGLAFEEVGSRIEEWADGNPDEYVSFATAVFCKDDIVYQGAFGYADRENGIVADEDTVYEWGSATKTLVWVSVMQLWERGEIDLETDIREYLPEGFFHNLKFDDPITMLNLMNHNAGWCENVWAYQTSDENKVMSLGEVLSATEPVQVYRPGEVTSYSNYGAALAGYIVECISGQPFYEYVHENIFEPLGMEHTSICPAHDDNPWVYSKRQELVSYANTGNGWISAGSQLAYIMPYPAGAATGTIGDMAKYAQSFVRDDCPLFEHKETRDFLFTPSSTLGDTDIGVSYHGLWSDFHDDVEVLGHNGATNAGTAYLYFDIETGVGTVVLMSGSGLPTFEIPRIVFGDAPADYPSGIEKTDRESSDISGLYIGARSMRHGPLKFVSFLGLLPVASSGDGEYDIAGIAQIKSISGDILWFTQAGQGFMGVGYQLEDGTRVLSLGPQSYVEEPTVIVNIALLVFYIVCAAIGGILLVIKLILLIAKKYKSYTGSKFITAAQIAKLVSIAVVVFWMSVFADQYGLTKTQGIIGCIIQMICFVTYPVAAGISCKALFSKGEKGKRKVRYIINILANVICVVAMLSLELMRFWNV